jgi:hypothetical protein
MTPETSLRLLIFLLRLGGVVTGSAFFAVLLPVEWMASTHEALGLGSLPRSAVFDYLARSVAALYGFHGVLLFVVSSDPVRYRPIVWYVAIMNIFFGLMTLAIDLHAGLPVWWTLGEGPSVIALGVIVAILNRSIGEGKPAAVRT